MRRVLYISLCVVLCSCASKQMRTSVENLEKQNQSLRNEMIQLQDKVNNMSNDMLVMQSRTDSANRAAPSVVRIQPPVVEAQTQPVKSEPYRKEQTIFGDDMQFTDEEPSLKFTNRDLRKDLNQIIPSAKSPTETTETVITNKSKGAFVEQTIVDDRSNSEAVPTVVNKSTGIEDPAIVASYNKAYKTFKDQDYHLTIRLMSEFLKKYPSHPYSDNAMFWIGESYFQLKNYEQANNNFQDVVQKYPNGNKVPDALLRSGICELRLSEPGKAKFAFEQLIKKYPESMAAKRAKVTIGEL